MIVAALAPARTVTFTAPCPCHDHPCAWIATTGTVGVDYAVHCPKAAADAS
jgi:hypothetical protein